MLLQSSKRVHVPQEIILGQLALCQSCLNYLTIDQHTAFRIFESILSKFLCDFRKGYSDQHCLLMMLETWKEATDNNKAFGALLTDLSKALDCLIHDLLIASLYACGLDLALLNIQGCLIIYV